MDNTCIIYIIKYTSKACMKYEGCLVQKLLNHFHYPFQLSDEWPCSALYKSLENFTFHSKAFNI